MKTFVSTGVAVCLTAIVMAPSAAVANNWLESATSVANSLTQSNRTTANTEQPVKQALVDLAMQQLNLTQTQAEHSLGGLFHLAKDNLSSSDFSQVSDAVPGIDALIALAPAMQEDNGLLGSLMSHAGYAGKALQGANYMKGILDEYGVPLEQLLPLVELASSYLQQNGNEEVASLFTQALSI